LYDGVSRVMLRGSYYVPSKEFLDHQKKNGAPVGPVTRNLTKEPLATAVERLSAGYVAADMGYFQPAMGLVLAPSSGGGSAGSQQDQTLSPGSAILSGLSNGWKLISVGNTPLEGRSLVRIDLEGENLIRASALAYDLDAQRRTLQMQRESLDKQSSRMNAPQK
jgi:hypothetical protein